MSAYRLNERSPSSVTSLGAGSRECKFCIAVRLRIIQWGIRNEMATTIRNCFPIKDEFLSHARVIFRTFRLQRKCREVTVTWTASVAHVPSCTCGNKTQSEQSKDFSKTEIYHAVCSPQTGATPHWILFPPSIKPSKGMSSPSDSASSPAFTARSCSVSTYYRCQSVKQRYIVRPLYIPPRILLWRPR